MPIIPPQSIKTILLSKQVHEESSRKLLQKAQPTTWLERKTHGVNECKRTNLGRICTLSYLLLNKHSQKLSQPIITYMLTVACMIFFSRDDHINSFSGFAAYLATPKEASGFAPHHRQNNASIISRLPCHQLLTSYRPMKQRRAVMVFSSKQNSNNIDGNFQDAATRKILNAQCVMGVLSAVAWIFVSITALSYHPDPKFADCTLRHNILTMSQAFAFPLPVGYATIAALSFPDPKVTRRNQSCSVYIVYVVGFYIVYVYVVD